MISRFEEFIGNASAVQAAEIMVKQRRIPQLVVIEGQEGSGRRTLAGLIAAGTVCSGENPPCLKCKNCIKVKTGHPDIIEINPDRTEKSIGVDVGRSMITDSYIKANEAEYKVYLVNEAQFMTIQAQNSLLKVLEEAPSKVLFIFTCISRHSLLKTVLSRSVVLTLSSVSIEDEVKYLENLFPEKESGEIYNVSVKSGGIIGRAINVLGKGEDKARSLATLAAEAVAKGRECEFIAALIPCEKDRSLLKRTLSFLSEILRDAYVSKSGFDSGLSTGSKEVAVSLKRAYTSASLSGMIQNVLFICGQVDKNVSQILLLTVLSERIFCI